MEEAAMQGEGSGKADELAEQTRGLGRASFVALLGGILIGGIGAVFRASLEWLELRHVEMIDWAQGWPWLGWVLPVGLGALGAGLARWMVRSQPLAAGSGVQHVEAVMRGEAEPTSFWVVPIKFAGGLSAIGAGLALGREGPTIQMGATIGAELARRVRCAKSALRDLQAALGGAGLAVAFNAPVGGALFVFEEVAHAFKLRLTIVTLIGVAAAITVARMILGDAPDFDVADLTAVEPWSLCVYAVLGGLLGLLGVFYAKLTVLGLDLFERLHRWPVEIRAAVVGATVGVVGWFSPNLVGGGDPLSQEVLNSGVPLGALVLILGVRWFLGPLSYAAGTPGGIFSPLLLVGAVLGALFAGCFNLLVPEGFSLPVVACSVVGMSAFFTGVVRAPITGVVLIAEMTGSTTLFAPMLAASFGAMLGAVLIRGEPIYDTLRTRMLVRLKER